MISAPFGTEFTCAPCERGLADFSLSGTFEQRLDIVFDFECLPRTARNPAAPRRGFVLAWCERQCYGRL